MKTFIIPQLAKSYCLAAALSLVLVATAPHALAGAPPSIETLKLKAEQSTDGERGKLCAEIARQLVEVADGYYSQGDVDKAEATVEEILSYAQKARESVRGSNHKLKPTEILLRGAQRRLEDMRRTLAASDQPRVQAAVGRLESIRRELLDQMFGTEKKKEKS